jgi:hypothetical protein
MSKQCTSCKEYKSLDLYHNRKDSKDGKASQCKVCRKKVIKKWRENNHEKHKEIYQKHNRIWCKNNPDKRRGSRKQANMGRSSRVRQNTPNWADTKKIADIYIECRIKSKSEGIEYHVDHIVPLKHHLVCGLHVPDNLQIIPQWENDSKGNRFYVK